MTIPRAEFIFLPTQQLLETIYPDLIRMVTIPPLDAMFDLAISVINQEVATQVPADAIALQRVALLDFEVESDYDTFGRILCSLTHGLKDLFLTFQLYGADGVDYRFWRMVNDDCILQHIRSTTHPPASVYRGTHLPRY